MLAIYNSIRLINTGKRNNVKVLIFSKKIFAIIIIIMQTLRSSAEVISACMFFFAFTIIIATVLIIIKLFHVDTFKNVHAFYRPQQMEESMPSRNLFLNYNSTVAHKPQLECIQTTNRDTLLEG